jgi:hypothetical protein
MPFTASARECLAACAEITMPAGARLPAGGEATVAALEAALEALGATGRAARLALEALTRSADLLALPHGRRSLAALAPSKRLDTLEAWRTSGAYPLRSAHRLLMLALKAAHYGREEVAARAPCRRPVESLRPEPDPPWMARVIDLAAPDAGAGKAEELEVDVAIVGSGAGGAAAARVLASAGLAVVVLEAGAYHRRQDFVGSILARTARFYARGGFQSTLGNVAIALPTGEGVGGSTTINAGTCLRTPPWVLRDWRDRHDVPLADAEIEPYFERVERWLEVGIPEPRYLGMQATIIARGAEKLGLAHGPLLRNAPGCDGQGLCYFGCPTGAKRSADVSLIPAALSAGAMLYTHARVGSIVASRDGVKLEARASSGRTLRVQARTAIVAAGSLVTPLLLASAGCKHAMLGRNLSIHPAAGAIGLFPFDVDMEQAIPQGYGLEGLREQGLLFEGGATPFELTALALDVQGPRLVEILEQHHRLLTYGFNVRDTSRGRVRRGPGGAPVATYQLGDADVAQLQFGMRTLLDLLAAGGASAIFPPVYGLDEVAASKAGRALDGRVLRADDLTLSAYHPLGTARMGRDPATSVVDMELRVRGMPSVMVCDGSVVPTSMGANPQITIMSLAARAAERLAARLG